MKDTKTLVITALMAAFTCIATMAIKIPTPTFGYIHPGDGLVLLCGILLGPGLGGVSAGVGSMFADIFSGYLSFAPATLVIKGVTAAIAGVLFRKFKGSIGFSVSGTASVLAGGGAAELFMVAGYFACETFFAMLSAGSFAWSAFLAGMAAALAGVPFNIVQGIVGVVIAAALLPALGKIRGAAGVW